MIACIFQPSLNRFNIRFLNVGIVFKDSSPLRVVRLQEQIRLSCKNLNKASDFSHWVSRKYLAVEHLCRRMPLKLCKLCHHFWQDHTTPSVAEKRGKISRVLFHLLQSHRLIMRVNHNPYTDSAITFLPSSPSPLAGYSHPRRNVPALGVVFWEAV